MQESSVVLRLRDAAAPGRRGKWLRWGSQLLLLLVVLLLVNEGAFVAGLPALQGSGQFGKYPFGDDGLILSAWLAAAVLCLAILDRRQSRNMWLLIGGVAALLVPGVLSLLVHGGWGEGRALALFVTSAGVIAAGASSSQRFMMRLAFGAGTVIAWGSLAVGLMTMAGIGGVSALEMNSNDRYREWLGPLSTLVEPGRFGALVGLTPSRQTLGPAMAMLLVIQVTLLVRCRSIRSARLLLVAPVGCALALIWSMSRTGLVGAVIGLGLTFVPLHVLRRGVAAATLTALSLLVWLLPFATAWTYPGGTQPQNTWEWRRALWAEYLHDDAFFSMFGIGAAEPPPLGAGHAHNLLVESVVNGGQLGLLGLIIFVLVGTWVVVAAAPVQRRLALGVWGAFVIVASLELPVTVRHYSMGLSWFILLLTLAAAAAVSRRSAAEPETAGVA